VVVKVHPEPRDVDVVIVGAGIAGLYQLHSLRERGFDAVVLEAAPDVGGTWYWNAYPGARCDVESMSYSYSFSPELDQEWVWTERYAAQPEILSYLRHVADRFDLRRSIRFGVRVASAHWNDEHELWTLTGESGEVVRARACVFATGTLSAPLSPPFEGVGDFAGESYQTQLWPHHDVSFAGKRVGVVGTGSSGVQSIPVIAATAAHVTVFQRTANFSIPTRNRPLSAEEIAERKADYDSHRAAQRRAQSGYPLHVSEVSASELSAEEQAAELERRWAIGGAPVFNWSFNDVTTSVETNTLVSDFVRQKIRATVADPATAELLVPTDHPIVAKRLIADTGYFESFNRPNVDLVDVRTNPIRRVRENGIELHDGTVHELDTVVWAIGYDAISGPLLRIDVTGRAGRRLRDEWASGPSAYLGLMIAGFPNLFLVTGPGSPAVLAVMTVAIEHHVEWITATLTHLRAVHGTTIEADHVAQREWMHHVDEIAAGTVFPLAGNSYYLGANVPGKPRAFSLYAGGQKRYRDEVDAIVRNGYAGFRIA
jgi:cyclohexanone monooxygenase